MGGENGVNWGIIILARCEYHLIRVYENLVQHPSNNISIKFTHLDLVSEAVRVCWWEFNKDWICCRLNKNNPID